MRSQAIPLEFEGRERMRGAILASIGFHIALVLVGVVYQLIQLRSGNSWGNPWENGSSAKVNAVASLPGVPLPAPMITTPNTVANQNPGLYQEVPLPQPPPLPNAEEIPKFKDEVKPDIPKHINTRIQKETLTPPPNAIPMGAGGQPAMAYHQFDSQAGQLGIGFDQGDFGSRFGWYVEAVRTRVSGNWLLSTVSPNLMSAPRVFVDFTIQRDGSITNVRLVQTSGNQEVDRSTLRAIEASNPLGPLPPGFSGSQIPVHFYFDFRR